MRALLVCVAALGLMMTQAAADPPAHLDQSLYANQGYDPQSNPVADLNVALQRAQRKDKRVLIIVGGDWCVWCDILDIISRRMTTFARSSLGPFSS